MKKKANKNHGHCSRTSPKVLLKKKSVFKITVEWIPQKLTAPSFPLLPSIHGKIENKCCTFFFFFFWIFHSHFCPFLSIHLPGNCVLNVRRVIVKYLILVLVKLFKKFKCDENEKRIKWIHRNFCTPLILVVEWGSECWRKRRRKKNTSKISHIIA